MRSLLTLLVLFTAAYAQNVDFLIGFATAAYQVEGAWNESGKGENVWDRAIHTVPGFIVDGSTADVAADQYHKYLEDVELMKEVGAQLYRFSLSWGRILPDGDLPNINTAGIEYYNNLIDALLKNGIEPMVTLFHWDLPQRLQELGGWPNPLMADYFADYAHLAFSLFGDRVKYWITFNEPMETCKSSYGQNGGAPALNIHGVAEYLCAHTLIKAHAKAYHIYNDTFRADQRGLVGITLNGGWVEPNSTRVEDIVAAETAMSFQVGWYADPIFSETGDYPAVMRKQIDENSLAEGRNRSRLPTFTSEEVAFIKGTYDFFGCNHYSSSLAVPATEPSGADPSWERDQRVQTFADPSWPTSASSWLHVVPWGIRRQLNYIKKTYNNPLIFITENGFSDHGEVEDTDRVNYYDSYLEQIIAAVEEDDCNVGGYTAWSLIDNFEWRRGYSERFGIISIDFEDPERPRTPKLSYSYFKELLSSRKLPTRNEAGKWQFD